MKIELDKQIVHYKDLGVVDYKTAWDYQEKLLQENVAIKIENRQRTADDREQITTDSQLQTKNYLLFCEHPPVYTLGKSGDEANILIKDDEMHEQGIQYFKTNRGGDITFHGLQQVVGYPIIDLENFYTDIGRYLRELEDVVILTLVDLGVKGERSKGETGVWIEPGITGNERKICAMGVRCSRWITMHGFALNVNTDLSYFNNIIPCGIQHKQVTSLQKELGAAVDYELVKKRLVVNFEKVFNCSIDNY